MNSNQNREFILHNESEKFHDSENVHSPDATLADAIGLKSLFACLFR